MNRILLTLTLALSLSACGLAEDAGTATQPVVCQQDRDCTPTHACRAGACTVDPICELVVADHHIQCDQDSECPAGWACAPITACRDPQTDVLWRGVCVQGRPAKLLP